MEWTEGGKGWYLLLALSLFLTAAGSTSAIDNSSFDAPPSAIVVMSSLKSLDPPMALLCHLVLRWGKLAEERIGRLVSMWTYLLGSPRSDDGLGGGLISVAAACGVSTLSVGVCDGVMLAGWMALLVSKWTCLLGRLKSDCLGGLVLVAVSGEGALGVRFGNGAVSFVLICWMSLGLILTGF